jgi:hypothetical protein
MVRNAHQTPQYHPPTRKVGIVSVGRGISKHLSLPSTPAKSDFNHARKEQFAIDKQYEKLLFLASIAVDEELDVDEKLDAMLRALALFITRIWPRRAAQWTARWKGRDVPLKLATPWSMPIASPW